MSDAASNLLYTYPDLATCSLTQQPVLHKIPPCELVAHAPHHGDSPLVEDFVGVPHLDEPIQRDVQLLLASLPPGQLLRRRLLPGSCAGPRLVPTCTQSAICQLLLKDANPLTGEPAGCFLHPGGLAGPRLVHTCIQSASNQLLRFWKHGNLLQGQLVGCFLLSGGCAGLGLSLPTVNISSPGFAANHPGFRRCASSRGISPSASGWSCRGQAHLQVPYRVTTD